MRFSPFFLCALFALPLVGAGCSPDSPVSLDKYHPPTATPSAPPIPPAPIETPTATGTPNVPATTTTREPATPTTITTSTMEPLAFPGILPATATENKRIRVKTPKGDIVFDLLPKEGPKAASNFVYLVRRKFYNGLTFHRVEPGFVIQGGDPVGNGMGGPGYRFEDDLVGIPYTEGIVAMANSGPNTNGSQFFILLADNSLPPNYSIFGRVVKGMDVVKKIAIGDRITSIAIEKRR